ncbi:pentapeptide repeat-containing protein [Gloeothece verrucosa]|uniref:Heat shock protein DnaJ domain protein n=1 Tax=Gloeothece verrucosa (strain PCC 7822) TaxID=497965 RepID=E0U9L5_GLOV7|nr:pentapeptide repeat-containing protein [Gloeothece verrucosa]ADN13816.1 heat shock protein DnaJ domain protein [Gloeothece verrucosa PCC 7822]
MNELDRYYKMLGLELGASLEEINQAYKDLAFIWHPDRIPKDNPRLLEKATAKLQELNLAREQLRLNHLQASQLSAQGSRGANSSQPQPSYPSSPIYEEHHTSERRYEQAKRPYYRDYTRADFRGANLREKDFSGRNLMQADLSHADLTDSFLHKVNLERAILYRANLFRANLLQANLRGANLQQAHLIGADLSGSDLSEADLRGAKIGYGKRIMVKLTGAILTGAILPDGSIHH